jgi:hypothetical protein
LPAGIVEVEKNAMLQLFSNFATVAQIFCYIVFSNVFDQVSFATIAQTLFCMVFDEGSGDDSDARTRLVLLQ